MREVLARRRNHGQPVARSAKSRVPITRDSHDRFDVWYETLGVEDKCTSVVRPARRVAHRQTWRCKRLERVSRIDASSVGCLTLPRRDLHHRQNRGT